MIISPFSHTKIPDRVVIAVIKNTSKVLNEHADNGTLKNNRKLRRLAKSYNKLLKILGKKYTHDFPFYSF